MRIVVHCGQSKTGTTALQHSLWDVRSTLRKHGVCYPYVGHGSGRNHKWVTPLFLDFYASRQPSCMTAFASAPTPLAEAC